MNLTEGTVVAGRFRLVRELGKGGMGSVWLAHHTSLDTPCAVKFIRPEVALHADVRRRFDREAKAAAQLRSPHVVHVLDYGTCEDVPYLAMEYLEGEDLARRLRRVGRLPAPETVTIIAQIARALTRAHGAGLVHRDLKPENVFLVRDDEQEIVKVLDFGIAKGAATLTEGNTQTGALLGTPQYMSPEQAQGTRSLDYRSDLWSLGVLAFVCLTCDAPFKSAAFGDLLLKIMVLPLPVPTQLHPYLPPGFDAWFAQACARDPAQRFQSAKELADALASALGVGSVPRGSSLPHPPVTPAPSFVPAKSAVPATQEWSGPLPLPGLPVPGTQHASLMLGPPQNTAGAVSNTHGAMAASRRRSGLVATFAVVMAVLVGGIGVAIWRRGPKPDDTAEVGAAVTNDGPRPGATPTPTNEPSALPEPASATPVVETAPSASASVAPRGTPKKTPATTTAPKPPTSPAAPRSTYDPGIL